jgi:hypothetical protein
MYVAHFGLAYIFKRHVREIPLWLLFLAVQFADLLCFVLVLAGIETVRFTASENPFLRTHIEFVPISHSLISQSIIAIAVYLIFTRFGKRLWGAVLAAGIVSHWVLDFLVHISDVPVFFTQPKVGLGLWNHPWISYALEIGFVLGGAFYLFSKTRIKSLLIPGLIMVPMISGMLFAEEPPAIRSRPNARVMLILVVYIAFIVIAYFSERRKKSSAPSLHGGE